MQTMVCIFVLRFWLYFDTESQQAGSIWIVLTPHSWASSRVSKILASVL